MPLFEALLVEILGEEVDICEGKLTLYPLTRCTGGGK